MSSHISDELPRLLTGDAGRDVVMAAAEHLRVCPDCQQDLVSAVVAHAALTSAHRFAPEIVSGDAENGPVPDSPAADDAAPLPDLSSVFAHAHKDAAQPAANVTPMRKRRRLVAVAAAAAVIVGGGGTVAALELGSSNSSARSVALTSFVRGDAPTSNGRATVRIGSGKLYVDASKLPTLDSKHVYELWLTDPSRSKMQSVGSFGNGKAELTVASKVMSQYNDFEVSVQKTSQIRYSGVSVVRGQYG